MGKPERSEETLTTRTMGLEIFNPFGRDTTQMLHIYADISTGFIGASITDVPVSGERVEERRWEPYMDNKQWGSNRSRVPEENDCNEPDEDEA